MVNLSKNQKKGEGKRLQSRKALLERIKFDVAGIDISSQDIKVAVIDQEVHSYSTFTEGIKQSISYMQAHGVTSIVIEATGIYWLPMYDMYEQAGMHVLVVNGAHVKNVPGRKTDVLDSEWLRELHTFGLLRGSFVPTAEIREFRTLVRLRDDHITLKSMQINLIQKHLDAMNLKLHNVISDIDGKSGMLILKSILNGERNPLELVKHCDLRIEKDKHPLVIESLNGNYKDEYLFGLQQAVKAYEFYQSLIRECDQEIDKWLTQKTSNVSMPTTPSPSRPTRSNQPIINDLHHKLLKLTNGKDVTGIPGLTDSTMMKLIAETGFDLKSKWSDAEHFTAWCGLAPAANSSGKGKPKKKRRKTNRTGQIFRSVVCAVGNSKYKALGGFYRRIRSRSGTMVANKATARKIAVLYYDIMTKGLAYVEEGLSKYEEKYKQRMLKAMEKKVKEFGMQLVPC